MFTNKHFIIALIVAPILAIIAWFAVGMYAGETPQAAVAGNAYPLVEKSNCRYDSKQCDLANEKFRLTLTVNNTAQPVLNIESFYPLDGIMLAVSSDEQAEPTAMTATDNSGKYWQLNLAQIPSMEQRIRIVANAAGSQYYADASTAFLTAYR